MAYVFAAFAAHADAARSMADTADGYMVRKLQETIPFASTAGPALRDE